MDVGDGVTLANDVAEGEFSLREIATIFVSDHVEPSLEALRCSIELSLESRSFDVEPSLGP